MKKAWLAVGLLLVVLLVVYAAFSAATLNRGEGEVTHSVSSFEACVAAGYAVEESNPARCVTPEGVTFTSVSDSVSSTTVTPTPTPGTVPPTMSFGTAVTLVVGKTVTFVDGLTVTLREVTDSRCPEGAYCIWAGELGVLLTLSGDNVSDAGEVRLGTVTAPTLTQYGYTFTLGNVSANDATVTVTKAAEASGTVRGTVTVGPICPVESIDNPCVVSPEVYTSRSIVVYGADIATEIKRLSLSATGTYTLALSPGTYWLQISPAGIGEGEKKRVLVTEGGEHIADFDIDTGIR